LLLKNELSTLRAFRHIPALIFVGLLSATLGRAEQRSFELDPAQTQVDFILSSTLHTVHGSFHLKRGSIQFDDATGQAGGQLVVDSVSGQSGNDSRDKRMHKEILESPKYSDIIFTPQRIKGTVAADGKSQVEVDGLLALHGRSRPMTLIIQAQLQGGSGSADTTFPVPYLQWGLKNPSNFILRVSDKVEISVHAIGRLAPGVGK
jgi:polyisoprenoid-binding protein YceI